MLSDAVIILANMRGSYINIGSTVHTLFRMSGKRRPSEPNKNKSENVDCVLSGSEKRLTAMDAYSQKQAAHR